ncbi:tRNA (adenosine(37)-N6)-dimethylallyltransferase MiaA [Actinobaculum suis]|uniref:tRNA (adenosine(37)-N6)-dimethylallyltransferase MiaA n=1 Tax=Actinobaculum suis TaxID=1657 RepID=UPI0009E609C6|nr:tRNA (adenosine(37)-N6)-dimethylallyltransferase MiaA [Actinobaculum suis]
MIIAIVGPTASGKTAISLELAEMLGGGRRVEIISADAFQLYRGMDIGTAKATPAERQRIRHHLIDVLDISEEASVAAYQKQARAALANTLQRGKIPLVVGGSGLYVSALLDELDFPGTDPQVRAQVEKEATADYPAILRELATRDPQAYETLDHRNRRRVIRAVEIIRLRGHYTSRFPRRTSHYPEVYMHGINRERAVLHAGIHKRVEEMFAAGLLTEVAELLEQGLANSPTARRATGYAQAIEVLAGRMSQSEAIEIITVATRQLARKQISWFTADPRLTWHDNTAGQAAKIAAQIYASLPGQTPAPGNEPTLGNTPAPEN